MTTTKITFCDSMKLILIFGLILSTSCTSENDSIEIGEDFVSYVDEFIREATEIGYIPDFTDTGLKIEFGSVSEDATATCTEQGTSNSGSHHIIIDQSYWNQISNNERKLLIYHELGHCELNRTHDNQIYSSGDWKSIMRGAPLPPSRSIAVNFYGERLDHYIKELFEPEINTPTWVGKTIEYSRGLEMSTTLFEGTLLPSFRYEYPEMHDENFHIDFTISLNEGEIGVVLDENTGFSISINQKKLIISSDTDVLGELMVIDVSEWWDPIFNMVAIKKVDGEIFIYVNMQQVYWTNFPVLTAGGIKSLNTSDNSNAFLSISIKKI